MTKLLFQKIFFIAVVIIVCIISCKKENDNFCGDDTNIYGDTIKNVYFDLDTIDFNFLGSGWRQIYLDSNGPSEFNVYYQNTSSSQAHTSISTIRSNGNDPICFLDSSGNGSLIFSMNINDTVFNYSSNYYNNIEWACTTATYNTPLYLKNEVYTPNGSSVDTFTSGIKYFGFRFPKEDGNHVGWLKLHITDDWLLLIEAHYNTRPSSKILIGQTN